VISTECGGKAQYGQGDDHGSRVNVRRRVDAAGGHLRGLLCKSQHITLWILRSQIKKKYFFLQKPAKIVADRGHEDAGRLRESPVFRSNKKRSSFSFSTVFTFFSRWRFRFQITNEKNATFFPFFRYYRPRVVQFETNRRIRLAERWRSDDDVCSCQSSKHSTAENFTATTTSTYFPIGFFENNLLDLIE